MNQDLSRAQVAIEGEVGPDMATCVLAALDQAGLCIVPKEPVVTGLRLAELALEQLKTHAGTEPSALDGGLMTLMDAIDDLHAALAGQVPARGGSLTPRLQTDSTGEAS